MQENREKCMELANRIYDLDAEVYSCVGSALGRTFTGNRESTVQNLCSLMLARPGGHLLRSELALISNMARTIRDKGKRAQMMAKYDAILKEGAGFLDMVGVGRVDLSSSMGLTRADINSDTMFEAVSEIAKRSREAGLRVCFGGGISFDAIPFIQKMTPLADRFETRKVHFEITDDERVLRRGILLAMKFEALYLESKCTFYDRMAGEDRERMKMMYERIAVAEGK